MCISLCVHIHIYIGERLEVPRSTEEPLSLIDNKHTDAGMLTFMALRHQKMLLRQSSLLHRDGGWGGC